MLVGKFMQRTKLDTGESLQNKNGDPKPVTHQKLIRVSAIVSKEFDYFIDQQTFTQKNLKMFESDLITKLKDILDKDGVKLVEFKSQREMTNNLSLPHIKSPDNMNEMADNKNQKGRSHLRVSLDPNVKEIERLVSQQTNAYSNLTSKDNQGKHIAYRIPKVINSGSVSN